MMFASRTRSPEPPDQQAVLKGSAAPPLVATAPVGEAVTIDSSGPGSSFNFANIPVFSPATLPQPLRARMERSFGESFAEIRIHEGRDTPTVGASALTTGRDLHFAPGSYRPGTPSGDGSSATS